MPRRSDEWISRIGRVEMEYEAARLALLRLNADARRDPTVLEGVSARGVQDAIRSLEGTYIIRSFAEFETGLRLYWGEQRDTHPGMTDLVDAIASRRRIGYDVAQTIHTIRIYRNILIHEREEKFEPIPISAVKSGLCRFFRYLSPW